MFGFYFRAVSFVAVTLRVVFVICSGYQLYLNAYHNCVRTFR